MAGTLSVHSGSAESAFQRSGAMGRLLCCWRSGSFKCGPARGQIVGGFARGSTPWLALPLLAIFVFAFLWSLGWGTWLLALALVAMLVELFFLVFFRDPDREASAGVCSPADGKVEASRSG